MGSNPGSGRSPGGGNGNLLHILAWRIPWTEEPGRLQFMGSQKVRHDLATTCSITGWKQTFPWASLGAQMVKNQPAMWEAWEKEMAIHYNICAWRISMDRGAWQATVYGVAKGQT